LSKNVKVEDTKKGTLETYGMTKEIIIPQEKGGTSTQ
jgi:hypothetical protein